MKRGVLAVAAVALIVTAAAGVAAHPLDPLGAGEIATAVAVLRDAGDADAATRFPLIELDEPDKAAVMAWRPGMADSRRAFVVARRDRTVYEGIVDLGARRVASWRAVPGVQSAVLPEEWEQARRATRDDPGWQAALRRRGYTAFDRIECAPLAAGEIGDAAEQGRRLARVVCFDAAGIRNLWARPIEGLLAVVDLDQGKVVRLTDSGAVPVSREPGDFGARPYPKPQPASTARRPYAIAGSEVRWRQWSFHYRVEARAGLVLSLLGFDDGGRRRLVLYRGSLAEMFVPYMDPDPNWAFRAWLDVGEYGFGRLASPLVAGTDCPPGSAMLDAVLPDDRGRPIRARSVACLFERAIGAPLWRHAEAANRSYAGKPARELVMRTIPSIGNYDYVIDWVLTEAGEIRIEVGATGIVAAKGVAAASLRDPSAAGDTAHGALVAPHLVAVNHDHFLSFRLDVDIDGAGNTLMRRELAADRPSDAAGRRSLWRNAERPVATEGAQSDHDGALTWRVVNPNVTDPLGRHPGYALRLGHRATSLLPPDDIAQLRAAFSGAPLWVTAYDPHEMYAAGLYPGQGKGGGGLPAYAARQRPVENADLVLWCTIGFHHAPRPEDWPVMPTVWHSISLVPDGFFTANPALTEPHRRRRAANGKNRWIEPTPPP